MPIFQVWMECEMECCDVLQWPDLANGEATSPHWLIVSCDRCNDSYGEVCLDPTQQTELPTGRATANLVMKCKGCKQQASINLVPDSFHPFTHQNKKNNPIIAFEARGCSILQYVYRPDWQWTVLGKEEDESVYGIDDQVSWTNAREGWSGYNEKLGEPCSITEIQFKVIKV